MAPSPSKSWRLASSQSSRSRRFCINAPAGELRTPAATSGRPTYWYNRPAIVSSLAREQVQQEAVVFVHEAAGAGAGDGFASIRTGARGPGGERFAAGRIGPLAPVDQERGELADIAADAFADFAFAALA